MFFDFGQVSVAPSLQQGWPTKMGTFVQQVSLPSIFLAIFTGKLFLFYHVFSFSWGGGGEGLISLITWLVVTFGSPLATVLSELIKFENNNRRATKKLGGGK